MWALQHGSPYGTAHPLQPAEPPSKLEYVYEFHVRPWRDLFFSLFYWLLVLACIAAGIPALIYTNGDFDKYTRTFMEQSPTCDIGAWVPPPGSPAEHVYEVMFRHRCRAWLGISAACGLAGAAIYVILFAASAKWLTRFLVVVSLVATATVSVLAFLFQPSYIGFALAAAAGLSIIMLILTACVYSGIEDLFTIAGIALRKRAGALATSFWTQLFFLGILGLLSAFFDAAAYSGRVERTPGALPKLVGTGCTDSLGADLPCCSWRQGWGWPVYMSFCAAAGLWTYGIMIELKLYMMSGAIAEWYYSPTPPRLQAAAAFHCQRCAWSTSFGSVALSAVAMGLWRLVAWPFIHARATVNVVCMALTGRGFTSANEGVFERLTDAFTAVTRGWFAATFLLYNPLWLLSAFGGICVFLGEHYGVWGDVDPSSVTYLYTDLPYYGQPSLLFMRVVLAVLCFVVLAMGLTLGASYVTDALAVLFFCYTEDPDPSSCAEALVPTVMVTLLGTHRKLEANIVMPSSPGGGSSPSRTPYKGTPGGGYPGVTYVMGSGMSMTAAARANSVARPRATEEEEMQLGSFTTRNTNPFFSGPPPATLQPRSTAAASYMNSNTWQSPSQQTQSYRGAYPVSYYGP